MIRKLFRQMSVTQTFSALTTTLCLMIDSIVVGSLLGVDAMSAYGFSSPLLVFYVALGSLMVNGIQVRLGQAMGRGDRDASNACYSTSIIMSLALAASCILLVFAAGNPLCALLGAGKPSAENAVFHLTKDYLRGYMLGAPCFFLSQIMNAYLQSMGRRKRVLISMIAMSVTDVAGDFLSVYVFHGGMFGIGLASSLSYLASCIISVGYFLEKDSYFCLSAERVNPREAWEIFHAGSSVLLNQVFITVRTLAFNLILLGLAGNRAVAAFAAYMALINVIFSISTGVGSTTLMLSSMFYSEEDKASLHALVKEMLIFTSELTTIVVIVSEILSPWLLRLFLGSDPDLIAFAVPGLRLALLSVLPNMLSNVFKHYFLGIQKAKMTNLIAFLQGLGFNLPIVWVLSRFFGLTGFWIGAVTAQAATLLAIIILCWLKYGGVSFSPAAFSFLERGYGMNPDDCITLVIIDRSTAIEASGRLIDFCKQKGIDGKIAMKIGLCVEEIAMNILQHGFGRDKQSHSIEALLIVKVDRSLLRIRDDCFNFDPTKYLELQESDDLTAHIGLRMVMNQIHEANYVNTLGLNNLTLMIQRV